MTDHDRLHEMTGAYVLGSLEPEDRRRFEQHLDQCDQCRSEITAFAPIPGLLRRAGAMTDEPLPPDVIESVSAAAGREWRAIVRSRRYWRWTAVVALAVAATMTFGVLRPTVDAEPDLVLAVGQGPVSGSVSLEARTWGSALELQLEGLPQRDRYVAWVIGADGTREQCATWGATPSGRARLDGASGIATDEVVSVVITDGDGAEVLATAATG